MTWISVNAWFALKTALTAVRLNFGDWTLSSFQLLLHIFGWLFDFKEKFDVFLSTWSKSLVNDTLTVVPLRFPYQPLNFPFFSHELLRSILWLKSFFSAELRTFFNVIASFKSIFSGNKSLHLQSIASRKVVEASWNFFSFDFLPTLNASSTERCTTYYVEMRSTAYPRNGQSSTQNLTYL